MSASIEAVLLEHVENILTKITIIITITDKNYNYRITLRYLSYRYPTIFLFTLITLSINKYRSVGWSYLLHLVQELLISVPSFLAGVRQLCLTVPLTLLCHLFCSFSEQNKTFAHPL